MRDRRVLQVVFNLTQYSNSLIKEGRMERAEGVRIAMNMVLSEYNTNMEVKKKNRSERESKNLKNLHRSVSRAAAAEIRVQKNGN